MGRCLRGMFLLGLSLVGCHHEFPQRPDLPRGDELRPDAPARWDAAEDRPRADKSVTDRTAKDAIPIVDLRKDTRLPDLDLGDPCTHGGLQGVFGIDEGGGVYAAACYYQSAFNQCGASTKCNSVKGWALCTPSQYAKVYPLPGGKPQSNRQSAWLAGCVFSGGSKPASIDAACSACPSPCTSSAKQNLLEDCATGGTKQDNQSCADVGLMSGGACNHVLPCPCPPNGPSGFWAAALSGTLLSKALCCKVL